MQVYEEKQWKKPKTPHLMFSSVWRKAHIVNIIFTCLWQKIVINGKQHLILLIKQNV